MFADQIEIEVPSQHPFLKVEALLGHYDLRLYTGGAYVDVGRGSSAAARLITHSKALGECMGTIGQFCDFAADARLYGGAEHHNDEPVNVVFSGVRVFVLSSIKQGLSALLSKRGEPFVIGNAVVVSADSRVAAGAKIGNGAVLAAGALATGTLESFAIHGGVPAKKIRDRAVDRKALEQVHWWDFDTAYIGRNLSRLQELAVDTTANHVYRKPTPRMVVQLDENEVKVLGVIDGHMTDKVRKYISQLATAGPYQWIANIWD